MPAPATHPRPRVAVVLPNLDGAHLLDMVLGSLRRLEGEAPELWVVDDGSRDASLAVLAERHPDVHVVALGRNEGFAAAANRGVAATRTELVALLNTDVEVEPGWLAALVGALDRHPGAGSAASKMLLHGDPGRFDGAGDVLSLSGVPHPRAHGERDVGQHEREELVFGARGGAALYRRAALEDVGGFDERFFAYCEDVDWALRAQLRGWSCVYVPTAVALHMGSVTARATTARARRLFALHRRNVVWMLVKGLPASLLPRALPRVLLAQGLLLALAARDGVALAHLRGLGLALRGLRGPLRDRRRVQAGRRVGDERLLAVLSRELLPGSRLSR